MEHLNTRTVLAQNATRGAMSKAKPAARGKRPSVDGAETHSSQNPASDNENSSHIAEPQAAEGNHSPQESGANLKPEVGSSRTSAALADGSLEPVGKQRLNWRWLLFGFCLVHSLLFAASGVLLPWRTASLFGGLTLLLASAYALTAFALLARFAHWLLCWRWLSIISVSYWVWLAWDIGGAALALGGIYGKLGSGLGALLLVLIGVMAVFTWPVAIAYLLYTRQKPSLQQLAVWSIGPLLFMGWEGVGLHRSQSITTSSEAQVVQTLGEALKSVHTSDEDDSGLKLEHHPLRRSRVKCSRPVTEAPNTLVVAYRAKQAQVTKESRRDKAVKNRCLQGSVSEIEETLRKVARRFEPNTAVKLDWLRLAQPLLPLESRPLGSLVSDLLPGLALRPGLDGACVQKSCLMPWQVEARNLFAAGTPLAFAEKFKLGVALPRLLKVLGAEGTRVQDSGLTRITTHSYVWMPDAGLRKLWRGKRLMEPPTVGEEGDESKGLPDPVAVDAAQLAALEFVLDAQRDNGGFRYQLNFKNGSAQQKNPSIARHAGTTLALCELGAHAAHADASVQARLRQGIANAVERLASFSHKRHGVSALAQGRIRVGAQLGPSALGLVALLSCRPYVGDKYDELALGLSRFLIKLQSSSGHFNPYLHWKKGKVHLGPTPMFAAGQSIFALSLLEQIMIEEPQSKIRRVGTPTLEEVTRALDRGMDYTSQDYWPRPLRDLFFLRENWHCLAARAALTHHRHDGYERFCLDYVGFKSRFILDESSGVDWDLVGAVSFSNLFPPHNGSTAGTGEAMAAAIDIRRARGESVTRQRRQMGLLMNFVLRQQQVGASCFSCPSGAEGGFTGEMITPIGRIDHTQHAWSALGHGAQALWPSHDSSKPSGDS